MSKKEKVFFNIYIFIMGLIIFTCDTNKLITDLNYVRCGEATGIPKPVPQLTTIAYSILIIGVPLVLIAFGILTLVKALASSNVDEVVKARKKLGKKFVIAAAALLTASLVQFVINRVTNDGDGTSVAECISCFLYSTNCGASTTGNDVKTDTIYSNYSNGAIQTTSKNSNSNSSSNTPYTPSSTTGNKTYNVTDIQAAKLAALAIAEQGSNVNNVRYYMSFVANLAESKNKDVVAMLTDTWFAGGSRNMAAVTTGKGSFSSTYGGRNYSWTITQDHINVVKEVLSSGNRETQATEHDCYSDIKYIEVNGKKYTSQNDIKNKSNYVKNTTVICNKYGSKYTFESYPPAGGDPFGVKTGECR